MPQFDGRAQLCDSVLHASTELRGNMHFESWASRLRRQGAQLVWHSPADYDYFLLHQDNQHIPPANPVQGQAVQLLRDAFTLGASDIHLICHATHGNIALRRMGMLEPWRDMGGNELMTLMRAIYQSMTEAGSPSFDPLHRQEGRIVNRRFLPPTVHSARVHTEPLQSATGAGLLMTLRLLYDTVDACGHLQERLSALGYTAAQVQGLAVLAHRPGLTLVAGPTGSGKTTLLRHVFEALAEEMPDRAFLSIEDPPEYPMQRISQVLVDGSHVERGQAYAQAIAGALRADPDYLMVGEIRHAEAAAAALDAALTGHPVWTSIHAGSALGIFARLLSLLTAAHFADPLASLRDPAVLSGLIYQRLLPGLCSQCSLPLAQALQQHDYRQNPQLLAALGRLRKMGTALQGVRLRGQGCDHCQHTGRDRLLVAAEIVPMDAELLDMLAQRDIPCATARARQLGFIPTGEQALAMITAGQLDPLDAENCLGITAATGSQTVLDRQG